MPESMFGRPMQHLLPSQPQASVGPSSGAPDSPLAPVQPAPPQFKDFRFNSIGKQPDLLSRISHPQPDNTDYHSPTPSPTSSYSLPFTNDFHSKPSSRPTLLQQLAGSDFGSQNGRDAQTSQSVGYLASRIQIDSIATDDIANTARGTASRFPSPPLRVTIVRRTTEDASLIPPVEVLPQPPDSSPATPASLAPVLESIASHSPAPSTPLVNTTTTTSFQIPTSVPVARKDGSKEPAVPLSSLISDATMQDVQLSLSATTPIDPFQARQERLQSVSAKLASLASSLPQSSSQSPLPDPSSVIRTNASTTPDPSAQLRFSSPHLTLRYPDVTDQPSGRVELTISDAQLQTNDTTLALVPSPTALAQEYQNHSTTIAAAVQYLSSVLSAAHHAQIENEGALALRIRTFEEQRATFEQTWRAGEAALQQEFQELQRRRKELDAKETLLDSLEKEAKAREEARKGLLAKRQAQEEERRAAEAKRVQELQEEIATAVNELKEMEALKAKCQAEQLASETVQDDLPTKSQDDMSEEEKTVIKSRNELLCAVRHLRRMHADKVRKLEEANHTLHSLEEDRKKKLAEEAERLRAHAEIERARQVLEREQLQLEAERRRQEAESDRERARPLVEQQARAEAQVHALASTQAANGQTFEHAGQPASAFGAPREQGIADTTKIRMAREETSLLLETTNAMNVDDDESERGLQSIQSSSVHDSPSVSRSKQKKAKPISGGLMLAAPAPKSIGGDIPQKPVATPTSLSSSDGVAEHVQNLVKSPSAVTAEVGLKSSIPAQSTPGFSSALYAEIHPIPDHKRAFSRTPKSQTILDSASGGSHELNIGPLASVSPTQQNVNLRHLKRFRDRVEGNDSGDRSVRTIQVKSEENDSLHPKREEHDDREVQLPLSTNPPASLPPRPAVIPPPRPWMAKKRREAPASQIDTVRPFPPETNELPSASREAEVAADEQPREVLLRDTTTSQTVNVPVQLPASFETTNFLPGPVNAEPEASESRINADERDTQNRDESHDTTPSESINVTLPRELDGEDLSRSNRKFSDEHRRAHNAKGTRRVVDHYSPPPRPTVTSPTQSHRPVDPWRLQNTSNGPRAEPMRATSPIAGRKRPSEFNDNDHSHRARRQRSDVWIAQDHDRERTDSYRPHRDRRPDPELDERRAAHLVSNSPLDRTRPYPSDVPRVTYDNRTYVPEEPTASAARWEQSYRRTENDDTHQRYQLSVPAYNTMTDQHHADDTWTGQTHEPIAVERMDAQPDPSLLSRMHDTQRFLPRGRGKGEPSRGRGDSGRARGRGVVRGGTPLIERLKAGPSSLGDRLT